MKYFLLILITGLWIHEGVFSATSRTFYDAMRDCDFESVKGFIEKGVSQSALEEAFDDSLWSEKCVNIALYLLEKGALTKQRNSKYDPPLYTTAKRRNTKMSIELLKRGIPLESPEYNEPILILAAETYNYELADYLLAQGANPNTVSKDGLRTPLMIAGKNNDLKLAGLLLKYGATLNITLNDVPLAHYILMSSGTETLKYLMSQGLDLNATNSRGASMVHYAACYGRQKTLDFLLKSGFTIHDKDFFGNLPIHSAAFCENIETMEFLLKNGSNLKIKNNMNESAVDILSSDSRSINMKYYLLCKGYSLKNSGQVKQEDLESFKNQYSRYFGNGINSNYIIGGLFQATYLGLSIYVRESMDANERKNNPFGYFNAYGSLILLGGSLGFFLGQESKSLSGVAVSTLFGIIAGGVIAGITSKEFNQDSILYYASGGVVVLFPLLMIEW